MDVNLGKTIVLLKEMPEKQVEIIYMYAQFLKSQHTAQREERITKKYRFALYY